MIHVYRRNNCDWKMLYNTFLYMCDNKKVKVLSTIFEKKNIFEEEYFSFFN